MIFYINIYSIGDSKIETYTFNDCNDISSLRTDSTRSNILVISSNLDDEKVKFNNIVPMYQSISKRLKDKKCKFVFSNSEGIIVASGEIQSIKYFIKSIDEFYSYKREMIEIEFN